VLPFSAFRPQALDIEVVDGVATVLLDSPKTRNVMSGQMHDELTELFYRVNTAADVRAIVLGGAGSDFCAGSNPERLQGLGADVHDDLFVTVRRLVANMLSVDKPVIAAVNGSAMGVGATLALFSDVIIASADAVIADTHVLFGLAPGDGGALVWALTAGLPIAKYHLMTGEPLSAQRALELRLVNEIHSREDVLPRATEIAQRLADGPQGAIRGAKRILNRVLEVVGAGVLEFAAEKERTTLSSHEHAEALAAMLENKST
jgi:enoyl-CoA hydratase